MLAGGPLLLVLSLPSPTPVQRGDTPFEVVVDDATAGNDVVTTDAGRVRGVATTRHRYFKGIPFAAPPVRENRWRAPQPVRPWAPAVLDATEYGHNCLQHPEATAMGWPQPLSTLSEDCLTLNVFTGPPTTARGRAAAPVLFWIYGGGFQGGGGKTRLNGTWDAALLAGELVVVTSNYRLGVFGFAASEALAERERRTEDGCGRTNCSTGNYGILDQRRRCAGCRRISPPSAVIRSGS